ncbi:Homeobox-leucine zipper protein HAT3-like protein [Drosera capensis]
MSLPSSSQLKRHPSATHLVQHHHGTNDHDDRVFKVAEKVHLSLDERSRGIKRSKPEPNNRDSIVIVEIDDDQKVSSPNSTVSSGSGKRCERDISDDDDGVAGGGGEGGGERKKLRLTKKQSAVLERTFEEHTTLNTKQKVALAKQLSLRPRQVEVWFQNRRARTKLKQTEVDCEYLKRCVEKLTEENRRLQKEVQELRALKLSHSHINPPTTLTVCGPCDQRVAGPGPSASPSNMLVKAPVGGFRQLMPVKQQHVSTTVHNENLLTL